MCGSEQVPRNCLQLERLGKLKIATGEGIPQTESSLVAATSGEGNLRGVSEGDLWVCIGGHDLSGIPSHKQNAYYQYSSSGTHCGFTENCFRLQYALGSYSEAEVLDLDLRSPNLNVGLCVA